jgi:hypothetical protein
MRKLFIALGIIAVCLISNTQEIQHEAVAINIEVPVRVFKGETFIKDLALDDFELYEEGVLQEIEAVYLIKKTSIEKEEVRDIQEEEIQKFSPQIESRYFILLFDIMDFLPRVELAIDLFFDKVFLPSDKLMIITAQNVYNLKENSWKIEGKKDLSEQFKSIIRKDSILGSTEYKSNFKSLEKLATRMSNLKWDAVSGESEEDRLDYYLGRYSSVLEKMETMRLVDQNKLIQFAQELKSRSGQKNVFLFYQKEFLPQPTPKIVYELQEKFEQRQDIFHSLRDLFDLYIRDTNLDLNKIKRAYSDSSVSIHFLFLTMGLKEPAHGLYYREQSEDIFNAFYQLADATGGYKTASANALYAFDKAVEASENYYLLYYTPKDYRSDGKFRNIKVRVKGMNYKVLHRSGYVAD